MSHVFISYASEDSELAERVCRRLEDEDVVCWMAPRDIPPGKVYAEAIVDAITEARAVVVLLSSSANASHHVHREVELAGGKEQPFVPVMLEAIEPAKALQYFIRSSQWLDVSGRAEDEWIEDLVSALRGLVAAAPEIGTTIGSRLRLERVIGEGGMGIVYLAQHIFLDQKVAVKLMRGALLENETARKRFLDEARRARALQHESIVPVLDAGIEDGLPYVVMEYVEGSDLRSLIAEHEGLDPAEALGLLEPVARALDYAHAQGIVHRDVKPANILIAADGHVYLTDFGIAREVVDSERMTRTGAFVGTLEYAAPEQITGKNVDARTDVYALGCVLYHCLIGEPPFVADTDFDLMKAHTELPRPLASEKRTDLPGALDSVIAKAMATDKDDRFESCEELVAKTRAAVEGGPETFVPPGRVARRERAPEKREREPIGRKLRRAIAGIPPRWRRKEVVGVGAVVLAVAIGVAAWAASSGGGGTVAEPTPPVEPTPPPVEPTPPVEPPPPPVEPPPPPVEPPPPAEDTSFLGGKTQAEDELSSYIPAGAMNCARVAERLTGEVRASITCQAVGGVTVTHDLYTGFDAMYAGYRLGTLPQAGATEGQGGHCRTDLPAEGTWTYEDGTTGGRIVCFLTADGRLFFAWTNDALAVESFATGPAQPALYDWWSAYITAFGREGEEAPFPTPNEELLLSYLPGDIGACDRDPQETGTALASVRCEPSSTITAFYELFENPDLMKERYDQQVSAFALVPPGTGSCVDAPPPAENGWSNPAGAPESGRLACFEDSEGFVWFVWTHDELLVLSWASALDWASARDWWIAHADF